MTQHAASQTPGAVLLQEIFITHELERRPCRPPEYQAENRCLVELARELAHTPESILQRVTEVARELCHAETAGISLIEQYEGQAVFRWRALAGAFAAHLGNMTQRDFSPCGIVVDRRQVQLFASPGRYYPYLEMQPPIVEVLLLPFFVAGEAKGTLWIVTHDERASAEQPDRVYRGRLATAVGPGYGAHPQYTTSEHDRGVAGANA
jgi:transcriptional regulator with GAF, ATPase, and Fis domain